jgi:hypothetical protein
MADHAVDDEEETVLYIYTGGQVPEHLKEHITHAIIDNSIRSIDNFAFYECPHLKDVKFHNDVLRVGKEAFAHCPRLRHLILPGVRIIDSAAFFDCQQLIDVKFGHRLEVIRFAAFSQCISLRHVTMPSIRVIEVAAFFSCEQLTDLDLPADLEHVGRRAFRRCVNMRRIGMPLKLSMLDSDIFNYCENLVEVDFGGTIQRITSHLSLDSWSNDIQDKVNLFNRFLPTIPSNLKTRALQQCIESVTDKIKFYKSQHNQLLKQAATVLELALWKAQMEKEMVQHLDVSHRADCRYVCKSDVVIANVMSFLVLLHE